MEQIMSLSAEYPPFDMPVERPQLPQNSSFYANMNRQALARLHANFTAYYAHLVSNLAVAKSYHHEVKTRLERMTYVVRKEARGHGHNRETIKEEVETDPRIVAIKAEEVQYYTQVEYLGAQVKAVERCCAMLEEQSFLRTRKISRDAAAEAVSGGNPFDRGRGRG